MLDASGTPRLRVAPPYLVGGDGDRTEASLSVEGCAVDTSLDGPWDRPVTPPGAETCSLRVSWNNDKVVYPALLDPNWQTTVNMATARVWHTATLLSTGKVLVAGGTATANGTAAISSAELFDPTTKTWSTAGSMGEARVLSLRRPTRERQGPDRGRSKRDDAARTRRRSTPRDAGQGTWTSVSTNMNQARDQHTCTSLSDGRVLIAGGRNGTTTNALNNATIYNPAGTTGSFAAVTATMPTHGTKAPHRRRCSPPASAARSSTRCSSSAATRARPA